MSNRTPGYVLNEYLKFDRKIYSILGWNIGRPISFKAIGYFFALFAAMMLLGQVPIIGALLGIIPFLVKMVLIGFATYLLTDIGTEGRSPISFFRSFFAYHFRQLKRESFYKGKVLPKPKPIRFDRLPVVAEEDDDEEIPGGKSIRFTGFMIR